MPNFKSYKELAEKAPPKVTAFMQDPEMFDQRDFRQGEYLHDFFEDFLHLVEDIHKTLEELGEETSL
jgi:hypothetical protein